MDSKYKYYLLPEAAKDFREIYDYIKYDLYNETAAENLSQKFKTALKNACKNPMIYPAYKDYRRIVVDNYLVFFKIDEENKRIIVYHAKYGAMDYDRFL